MATQDLCAASDVRTFLQKSTGDTAQDTEIENMITPASDAIMRHCEREFKTTASGSTARTFEYAGGGFLSLAPYDAQTVTLVRIDTDQSSPTTLSSTDYRLWPNPAKDGVYTNLRLEPFIIQSTNRFPSRLVEVTGTWGFPSVPTPVKRACVLTVAVWLRRDVTAYENALGPEGEEVAPRSLPMAAVDLLEPYKRHTYA